MLTVIYSPQFLNHQTGRYHPECPQRLTAIKEKLEKNELLRKHLRWLEPSSVEDNNTLEWVKKIHGNELIKKIKTIASRGGGKLDPDTPVSAQSYDVALLAVSAWLDGVEQVCRSGEPCFILARPPGHHATHNQGMGFCLFSNAAIAANYALTKEGIGKVAIVDWDVHHGNGTEDIVSSNPNICYCSLHQYPFYPGTGGRSFGKILNIPLQAGSDIKTYQKHFETKIIPFLIDFAPDLLIVSAGYDANYDDPLANMALLPEDYGTLTKYCRQITNKIIFGLEGGYHLEALAKSVEATLLSCLTNDQEKF